MKNHGLLLGLLLAEALYSPAQDCSCEPAKEIQSQQRNKEQVETGFALERLAKETKPDCRARYQELLAEQFAKKGLFDSAFICLGNSRDYLKKNNCSEASYIPYYRLEALIHFQQGEYPRSLEFSLKLLPLAAAAKDAYEEATGLLLVAQNFNKMKESAKGIEYARKGITLLRKLNTPFEKASILSRLAAVYLWRYQDTKDLNLLDSARQFSAEQIGIARQHGFTKLLVKGYSMMNGYAHERGHYQEALRYLDSNYLLAAGMGDLSMMATNYGDKADVLMEMGNYREARRLADSCLLLHQQVGNPETIANAYALIYQISTQSENYKDAIDAMNSYIEIQDSLTNAEKSKIINELEQKYNKSENEKTIRGLAQQKRIYLLLAAAGLFALLGLVLFIRQQSLKNKKKILETEQRLNRARMNPHFFFNALASLQSHALGGSDGKSIAGNLSRFSHIMRETLESTYKEYVTLEQETEFLREYLELQLIRFPGKFSYDLSIQAELEPEELLIPSMILQPFVENSIEHGFSGIDYPGQIHILFEPWQHQFRISIKDNGKGLARSPREHSEHISRASQIIRDRIYLLNIKLKTKASFSIENNSDGPGVLVRILLPLLYKSGPGSN